MPPVEITFEPVQFDLPRLEHQAGGEIQRVFNEHENEMRRTGRLASGAPAPTAGLVDWLAGPVVRALLGQLVGQLRPMLHTMIDRLMDQLQNVPAPQPGGGIPTFEPATATIPPAPGEPEPTAARPVSAAPKAKS
jgi:hypothetical protein